MHECNCTQENFHNFQDITLPRLNKFSRIIIYNRTTFIQLNPLSFSNNKHILFTPWAKLSEYRDDGQYIHLMHIVYYKLS